MHIVHHPRCKDDIQDESGTKLPVIRQTDAHGQWVVSFWKPSAEELESIVTGGGVELRIKAVAHEHPQVSLATWTAIGPELIDGDPFMQRSTGYRCFECCAKEGQPHAEHCVDLVGAVRYAQSKLNRGGCEQTDGPPLTYPPSLIAMQQSALASMGLRAAPMVETFRAAGYRIAGHCAAEEAFIFDRVMRTVLSHGDRWTRIFTAQLRVVQDVAIEKHAAAQESLLVHLLVDPSENAFQSPHGA